MRAKTKFIIDPIVTFMAKYRFSPDTLTVLGMLFHFFYAWLIANGQMAGHISEFEKLARSNA